MRGRKLSADLLSPRTLPRQSGPLYRPRHRPAHALVPTDQLSVVIGGKGRTGTGCWRGVKLQTMKVEEEINIGVHVTNKKN